MTEPRRLVELPPPQRVRTNDALMVSIVIPVYNEGVHVLDTLQAIWQSVQVPYEIIVVYDMDEDSTVPVIRRLISEGQRILLAKNIIACGPSGALRTGFSMSKAPRVLVIMGDGCDDLSQIGTYLAMVPTEADIVCPSRYCSGGDQFLDGTPRIKAWIPRTAGVLLKWLAGVPTLDPTNSFKLYSAEVLQDVRLASTVSFSVTLELVAKAHCLGYRIVEVPTVWRDRKHGKSHFNISRSLVAYLPWFGLALLRGRLIRVPVAWLRAWFGSPIVPSIERSPRTTYMRQPTSSEGRPMPTSSQAAS